MVPDPRNSTPPDLDADLVELRAMRVRGDLQPALRRIAELEVRHPDSGLLLQERGACLRAAGEVAAALAAYERAVLCNDALADSWRAVRDLHAAAGRGDAAAAAAHSLARLSALPAELAEASSLLNEGRLDPAEERVRRYLQTHGAHVQGMRLLAQIGVKRQIFDDAEFLLDHILQIAPDYHDARYEYAAVLSQRRRYLPALTEARRLLALEPANRSYRMLYAQACDGLGRYDEALRVFRELSADEPEPGELALSIAHIQKTQGDAPAAIASFKSALASASTRASAFHALANMKTFRFAAQDIDRMRALEALPTTPDADRYRLCFGLGKALEDEGEYAESFDFYARGNALKRAELRFDPALQERNLRLQAAVCSREFFAARRDVGCGSPDPLFVLGLPRSGSTLIEQILASHSQVDGTLELPDIPRLVHRFRNRSGDEAMPRYPRILSELNPEDFARLGVEYLEDTRVHRGGAPFFVDKMPANFRDIGFIHLILPNARIIDARREPMACCFGNFKQLFTNGQEFTYSLEELGRYYRNYVDLMAHWDRVLPGKILRVQHEDLVADLEGSVRRLLAFCGLDFESGCLEFHKTARSVRTVSSEQVRRPIYREGMDQWRHFEPWLGPLRAALQLPPTPAATAPA